MEHRKFHRPAQLDQQEAEEIVGDEDPAVEAEVADTSAWALMGVANEDFDDEAIKRLRETVRREGVDVIAAAWSRSADFTLPGALWRIYLLSQWHQLNPEVLQARYDAGRKEMEQEGVANAETFPPLQEVLAAVKGVLYGYATDDDLAPVFEAVAQTMRVLAAGVEFGPQWITKDDHVLAYTVTRRPQALLDTAKELDVSAHQARLGTLD